MPAAPQQLTPRVSLDAVRAEANRALNPSTKGSLGQFMTPSNVARFMAGLFTRWDLPALRLLDAGAGVGSLTAAFLDTWLRSGKSRGEALVSAFELDPVMRGFLEGALASYRDAARTTRRSLTTEIIPSDFIAEGVQRLQLHFGTRYTHAILNPPYRKIGTASTTRKDLRAIGIETVNLYSAFLAVAIALLEPGGELVAIIPRSFCNGAYYRPFRAWMDHHGALANIHLFEHRNRAFKDDDVLQENIIARWIRDAKQGDVEVSWSADGTFSDLQRQRHPFSVIVKPGDPERFIHIPLHAQESSLPSSPLFECSLDELGLSVSTGPVVDFRLKQHIRHAPEANTVPLLYPQHFAGGGLRYPGIGKKPSAIVLNEATRRWLMPNDWYVITKRFTTKEERRRVVAHVINPAVLPSSFVGIENHINVFHHDKHGIDPDLAHGLALFLNSTRVDDDFRGFSGHTQVNATDLRTLRYPARAMLVRMGRWARTRHPLAQHEIDVHLEGNRPR
jgi:predicted RNA methylase